MNNNITKNTININLLNKKTGAILKNITKKEKNIINTLKNLSIIKSVEKTTSNKIKVNFFIYNNSNKVKKIH